MSAASLPSVRRSRASKERHPKQSGRISCRNRALRPGGKCRRGQNREQDPTRVLVCQRGQSKTPHPGRGQRSADRASVRLQPRRAPLAIRPVAICQDRSGPQRQRSLPKAKTGNGLGGDGKRAIERDRGIAARRKTNAKLDCRTIGSQIAILRSPTTAPVQDATPNRLLLLGRLCALCRCVDIISFAPLPSMTDLPFVHQVAVHT